MKEITLTCPFTGAEFNACEMADGSILIVHPLTGEQLKINWNCSIKKFNVPKNLFKHYETCTPAEAADILGVTRQRMHSIISDEVIPVKHVAGRAVFLLSDVYHYRDNRKGAKNE